MLFAVLWAGTAAGNGIDFRFEPLGLNGNFGLIVEEGNYAEMLAWSECELLCYFGKGFSAGNHMGRANGGLIFETQLVRKQKQPSFIYEVVDLPWSFEKLLKIAFFWQERSKKKWFDNKFPK